MIGKYLYSPLEGFPGGSAGKESACSVGDLGLIPGLGRSSGEGNSYPLQYCGLENSMDCTVHGVTKSWTRRSDCHFHLDHRLPRWRSGKEHACQRRSRKRCGFDTWVGRALEGGNGNPLQDSCLENSMDREAWWATVHWVAKSQIKLSTHTHTHTQLWTTGRTFSCSPRTSYSWKAGRQT